MLQKQLTVAPNGLFGFLDKTRTLCATVTYFEEMFSLTTFLEAESWVIKIVDICISNTIHHSPKPKETKVLFYLGGVPASWVIGSLLLLFAVLDFVAEEITVTLLDFEIVHV